MANLSQSDLDIILEHPLDKCLHPLQDLLQKAEESYRSGFLLYDGIVNIQGQRPQKALSRLLHTLQGHEVASNLPSKNGNGDIADDLWTLWGLIKKGSYDCEHYRTLSCLVIKQAPDAEIWNAVVDLIITVFPPTFPISIPTSGSIPTSFDSTPITRSSSTFQGDEQTRKIIGSEMFYELRECTYRGVAGFFEKYFEGRSWSDKTKAIYNAVKEQNSVNQQYRDGRWTDFPNPPDEVLVEAWLSAFQNKYLSDSRGVFYTTKSSSDLIGGEAPRQLDLIVNRRGIEVGGKHDWKDVCVIGELKRSKGPFKDILLQLAVYMRDAFVAQPTRRFMHGFFLQGTAMELWVFDRSGPYSSGEFNIHKEPEKFIQAIVGYTMMDDTDLGLDMFTKLDGNCRFITARNDATGEEDTMQLDEAPFFKQRAIVCRGTTCFRSSDQAYVVKFSWVSDKRPLEADHLRLAREKGVEGIAKLIRDQWITSISDLRSGLTFRSRQQFEDPASVSPLDSLTQVGQSSDSIDKASISNLWSKWNRSRDERVSNSGKPAVSLYESANEKYANRQFRLLAIAPVGQALSEFAQTPQSTPISSSNIKLLTTLRDAIKAHRSLYLKGGILHRDISENNIIITDPKETGGFTGLLIDLDLAKVIGSGRSGARHRTGTMEFMAIEVLLGTDHTYRHDLESFFYVLIWLYARRGWSLCGIPSRRPKQSVLTAWRCGSFKEIAGRKYVYMLKGIFDNILNEFPPAFNSVKPLCEKIRALLFPMANDMLVTGTPKAPPEKLYGSMIELFEGAITDITARQLAETKIGSPR